MVNQSKIYEVENIKATIKEAKATALIDYQGLTAEQVRQLREEIRQNGGTMTVVKNTLLTIALQQLGFNLDSPLVGPTALVTATEDEIAPLKAVKTIKDKFEKPEFKLGILEGKILSLAELEELVKLPGKEVLLAQFVAGLANPLQRLAGSFSWPQRKLLLVLKAIAEKQTQN
ncbi:50S ribosomal protein L10 [bacterium]|nr:50S ribosomal protein L10 [bacterium]